MDNIIIFLESHNYLNKHLSPPNLSVCVCCVHVGSVCVGVCMCMCVGGVMCCVGGMCGVMAHG